MTPNPNCRVARVALFVAALAFAVPGALSAQTSDGAISAEDRLNLLFSGLSVGQDVQIATSRVLLEESEFRSLGEGYVEVVAQGALTTVDLNEIRSLSVKSGHALQGALWGLGSGILVGGVVGGLVSSFDCKTPSGCTSSERRGAVLWGSIMGLSGATAGFVIGKHSVNWTPIFP